ncbi:MAG: uridine kinase [Clostridia bacterium]|nr:uridine kinase [Clostridia bacterium]
MLNEIMNTIEKIIRKKGSCIVAIDGRCGSGKTSLAEKLTEYFDCNVFHMDDFFLQKHQRNEPRFNETGGNVDYERFYGDVLLPLVNNEAFSYRPFDCQRMDFAESISIQKKSVAIAEGSYSCHPCLFGSYDLHIFLDIDKKTQLKRLIEREGEEKIKQFEEKWIPLEERYFINTELKYKCEIYYKTSV